MLSEVVDRLVEVSQEVGVESLAPYPRGTVREDGLAEDFKSMTDVVESETILAFTTLGIPVRVGRIEAYLSRRRVRARGLGSKRQFLITQAVRRNLAEGDQRGDEL